MYIEVDYNPSPSKMFFISAGLSDTEAISFDWTSKGHRVIKQVLRENNSGESAKTDKKDGSWEVILLKDGQFIKKYKVDWTDKGKIDEVNGEVWETVWEKPLPKDAAGLLLEYSQYISDNYQQLDEKMINEFEQLIQELIKENI
jgi:hypothetical protein